MATTVLSVDAPDNAFRGRPCLRAPRPAGRRFPRRTGRSAGGRQQCLGCRDRPDGGFEVGDGALAGALGLVHGGVGAGQQRVGVDRSVRRRRPRRHRRWRPPCAGCRRSGTVRGGRRGCGRRCAAGRRRPRAGRRTRRRRGGRRCPRRGWRRRSARRPAPAARRRRRGRSESLTALKSSRSRKTTAAGRQSRACSSRTWASRSPNSARLASPVSESVNACRRICCSRTASCRVRRTLSRTARYCRASRQSTTRQAARVSARVSGRTNERDDGDRRERDQDRHVRQHRRGDGHVVPGTGRPDGRRRTLADGSAQLPASAMSRKPPIQPEVDEAAVVDARGRPGRRRRCRRCRGRARRR